MLQGSCVARIENRNNMEDDTVPRIATQAVQTAVKEGDLFPLLIAIQTASNAQQAATYAMQAQHHSALLKEMTKQTTALQTLGEQHRTHQNKVEVRKVCSFLVVTIALATAAIAVVTMIFVAACSIE